VTIPRPIFPIRDGSPVSYCRLLNGLCGKTILTRIAVEILASDSATLRLGAWMDYEEAKQLVKSGDVEARRALASQADVAPELLYFSRVTMMPPCAWRLPAIPMRHARPIFCWPGIPTI